VVRGVTLLAAAPDVRAIGTGELIFSRDTGDFATVPPTLGSYAVLEHNGGLRSVYAHMANVAVGRSNDRAETAQVTLPAGETVGRLGVRGFSASGELLLSVHDPRASRAVNPLAVLPALVDLAPPIVTSLALLGGGTPSGAGAGAGAAASMALVPERAAEPLLVRRGRYDVRIEIADALGAEPSNSIPAHRVELYLDGRMVGAVALEALVTTAAGEVALADGVTLLVAVRPMTGHVLFRGVELVAGERHLAVVASDFAGNSAVGDYFVAVTSE
jgi:hypothetical protein